MFEVIVTKRVDFTEEVIARYPTDEEAQESARRFALENYKNVVRAWVREVREAKSKS